MPQTQEQVGRALVVLSVLLAVLVVVWLYRWEQRARTAEVVSPPQEAREGAPASPQVRAGGQAFLKLCDSCHPGGNAGLGPALLGLDQESFIRVTRQGKGAMPAYPTTRLSDQELETMYAYLRGLAGRPTPTPLALPSPTATPVPATVAPPPSAVTPTTRATPAAIATPAPAATPAGPLTIPHPLEGRSACLACHGSGVAGIPQVPANHAGRTNEMCTLCHSLKR